MIVLKILLWIILALLGIILLILVLPVSVQGSFIGGKVGYSVKFAFIPVFDSKGKGIVNKLLKWRKKKAAAKKDESDKDDSVSENVENLPVDEIKEEAAESLISDISEQADTYMTADEPTETVEAEAVNAFKVKKFVFYCFFGFLLIFFQQFFIQKIVVLQSFIFWIYQ